jgi:hypothetical protein
MFRTLLLFVKVAVGAFFLTCVLLGAVFWIFRTERSDNPPYAAAEPTSGAANVPGGNARVSPGVPGVSATGESGPETLPSKRTAAHKLVAALQFAEEVEKSKRRAVLRYPELGVKDTAVNREFVRRMRLFQNINPGYFEDAAWPEKLAESMAVDLSLDAQKPPAEVSAPR